MIREIIKNDLDGLLRLYMQLHDNPMPEKMPELLRIWDSILQDKNHHVIVAEENGKIVSSCICVIIPNMTHNQQPYAFILAYATSQVQARLHLATARGSNTPLLGANLIKRSQVILRSLLRGI